MWLPTLFLIAYICISSPTLPALLQVVQDLGTADIDARLEELLIDGILYAFQEQVSDDANVMLNGFGTVVNSLKGRAKPYLPQICGTIKWRLNNKVHLPASHDLTYVCISACSWCSCNRKTTKH